MDTDDSDLIEEITQHRVLHWNYRGYERLPFQLKTFGNHVQEIYMKMNNLKSLPNWIGDLKLVTNLYVSQNQLEFLPEEIREMKSLEVLDVSCNSLSELPTSIGLLPKLKTLLVLNNKLTSFPREMYLLPDIKTINAASNLIVSIEEICLCHTLEELHLDNNLIVSLPRKIVYMPKLKSLTLCRNNLLYLPTLPFITDIDISFDYNPSLNYIPYPLGCQITENSLYSINGEWDLRSFGCFELGWEPTALPNKKLQLPTGEKLVMPLDLKVIKNASSLPSPPSLQELSLGSLYLSIYSHDLHLFRKKDKHSCHMNRRFYMHQAYLKTVANALNRDLKKLLLQGPVSICIGHRCGTPIFSQCVAWVIPKHIAYRLRSSKEEVLSTILFCSHRCSNSFKEYIMSVNPESWEVDMLNSQKQWNLF
ncbi:hypothetical protein J437_LFUL009419 [Ladona fulva]|uniref:Uncharacterized protein n=1 Tax=Ladona fulva TaxID=123851 RepID=A0A8K0KEQ3_LADFU|nr:hypothetical protein J437_LFUL009419 [Ladona fulva]